MRRHLRHTRSPGRASRRAAALYARVSTTEQTPENQLVALRTFASARGWTQTEFVDHGVSGAKEKRPELDALLTDVRRRKVDLVLRKHQVDVAPARTLLGQGLSLRATARALGVPHMAVRRALTAA